MNLWDGLPLPIRRWCAPVAQALVRGMERGFHGLRLRGMRDAVDPAGMSGAWLDEFAQLYAFTRRAEEGDTALMARMKSQTILERMKTTEASIAQSVFEATGVRVNLRPSLPRVNDFDHLESMAQGDHSFDFSYLRLGDDGRLEEVFENVPAAMRGQRGLEPMHGAFGFKGLLIEVAKPYDPVIERQIIQSVTDKLPAQTGFELSWARQLNLSWRDTLTISDFGKACWEGFGEDPFGTSPFGSECEEFNLAGFGLDSFGDGPFGSLKPRA